MNLRQEGKYFSINFCARTIMEKTGFNKLD